MMSFIGALVPYIPFILQVVGFYLKMFGASADTLQQYQDLIDRANKEGHLSLESRDRLTAHKDAILARLEAKKKAKEEAEKTPTP